MIDWIAAVLPRKLVYACFCRVVAHGASGKWLQTTTKAVSHPAGFFPTSGIYPYNNVFPFKDISIRTVVERWEKAND